MPPTKARSRNYPSLSLGEALQRARELYKKEGRARVPAAVLVSAWGYNSLNGASLRVLSALRQYGLLEGSNEESRLSSRALTLILEPEESPDYNEALHEALAAPALFQEIIQEYGEDVPSDGALVSYLVRKQNFSESGARILIESFRESVDLVRSRAASYTPAKVEVNAVEQRPATHQVQPVKPMHDIALQQEARAVMREFMWPLSGNSAVTVRIALGDPAAEDLDEISQVLDLAKIRIRREILAVIQSKRQPLDAPIEAQGTRAAEDADYEVVQDSPRAP